MTHIIQQVYLFESLPPGSMIKTRVSYIKCKMEVAHDEVATGLEVAASSVSTAEGWVTRPVQVVSV